MKLADAYFEKRPKFGDEISKCSQKVRIDVCRKVSHIDLKHGVRSLQKCAKSCSTVPQSRENSRQTKVIFAKKKCLEA